MMAPSLTPRAEASTRANSAAARDSGITLDLLRLLEQDTRRRPNDRLLGGKVARDADPRRAETIHSPAEKFRNWGGWGADDQVGPLNYITIKHIRRAAPLVRVGRP